MMPGEHVVAEVVFHYLETSHQGWLAVRRGGGGICHLRSDEMTRRDENGVPLYCPLLAMTLPDYPDYVFLVVDFGERAAPLLWIKHFPYRGAVLPFLRVESRKNEGRVGLRNLFRPSQCCTAQPWNSQGGVNELLGDCNQMFDWEEFQLRAVAATDRLQRLGEEMVTHFKAFPSADYLEQLIITYAGSHLTWLLDAMIPVASWSVVRELGQRLLNQPPLREAFFRQVGESPWRDGWQYLARWLDDRESYPVAERGCPLSDAILAYGQIDALAGFAQATLHTARASVVPRKRVCMMSTIRNEGIYILEWIAYHRSIGVEHFFIYSNDNNDRSDLLLKALHDEGIITFIENPVQPGMSAQMKAYGHGLNVLPNILDYEWCFILDGDEFITLSPSYRTVGEYLESASRWESDAIAVNWRFVASEVNQDGLADLTKPLTQRNRNIVSRGGIGEGWRLVKSAVRPGRAIHSRPHHPIWVQAEKFAYRLSDGSIHSYRNPPPGIGADPAFADYDSCADIYISHYYYKSIIEWVWKYARNSGLDGAMSFGVERYADYWANAFICQLNDPYDGENENILIRLDGLLEELASLRSITAIAQAENIVREAWQERLLALLDMIEEADVASRLKEEWRYVLDPLVEERRGSIPLHQI